VTSTAKRNAHSDKQGGGRAGKGGVAFLRSPEAEAFVGPGVESAGEGVDPPTAGVLTVHVDRSLRLTRECVNSASQAFAATAITLAHGPFQTTVSRLESTVSKSRNRVRSCDRAGSNYERSSRSCDAPFANVGWPFRSRAGPSRNSAMSIVVSTWPTEIAISPAATGIGRFAASATTLRTGGSRTSSLNGLHRFHLFRNRFADHPVVPAYDVVGREPALGARTQHDVRPGMG